MPQYKFIDQTEQYKFLDAPAEEVPELAPEPVAAAPVQKEEPIRPRTASDQLRANAIGIGETAVSLGTGFLGALPGAFAGMYQAIKDKDINSYTDAFKFVQQFYTYEPKTPEGKVAEEITAKMFQSLSKVIAQEIEERIPEDKQKSNLAELFTQTVSESLPILLPFMFKGKAAEKGKWDKGGDGAPSGTAPKGEPPLEGEVLPRETPPALTKQEPPAIEGEIIKATPEQIAELAADKKALVKSGEQKLLTGPEEVAPKYELLPKNTPEAKVIDFELAKAKKDTVAEFYDWKDIEEIILEDPYKKGGTLETPDPTTPGGTKLYSGIPVDPIVQGIRDVAKGLGKVWEVVDESVGMREWRKFARPLQAGEPFVAAQVKDFANLKRVHSKKRIDQLAELDKINSVNRELMIRAIEDPALRTKLSPELNQALDNLIKENEALSQEALDLGIIGNIRKPYAPHIIKNISKGPFSERLLKQGYIKTGVRPAGTRIHETFEAGEAAGVEYVKDIKAMVDINYQLKDAIIGRHFVNYVKQWKISTGEELVGFPGQEVPGYVTINHPAFQQKTYIQRDYISYKGKNKYIKDDKLSIDGKTYTVVNKQVYIDGKNYQVESRPDVITKDIKVHPDIAGPLEAVLKADDPNIITKVIIKLKAATIGIIMYNPMFHNFTVFSKMVPTLPGAGFGKMIWNPEKVIGKEVYDQLSPAQKLLSRTWFSDYFVGNYLKANEANVVDAMRHNVVPLGGRGYRADLYGEIEPVKKNILRNFAVTEKMGKAVEILGDFWHGTLLWDRIGDAQLGLYNRYTIEFTDRAIQRFIKDNRRPPTDVEVSKLREDAKFLAGEYSNTIVGVFGREDFGHAWRNFLNTTLFSRSYTMSNVRLAEYALGIMPKHLTGQMKTLGPLEAQKIFTGYSATLVAKDLFLMLGTLYGLNYAFTKYNNIPDKNGDYGGHFPDMNEPGKELYIALGEKEDGTVVYSGIPFRAARDIFEMAIKPTTLWNNKLNPSIKVLIEELTNRDWRGKEIRLDGASIPELMLQSSEHIAKGLTGFDTMYDTFDPDDESWRNRYRFLGLQISHGAAGGMSIGNLKSIQREQQSQKDLVMQDALDHMKRGKEEKAIKLLLDNNLIGEIPGFVVRSKDPYASALINMNIKSLYLHATPKQKEALDKIQYGRRPHD